MKQCSCLTTSIGLWSEQLQVAPCTVLLILSTIEHAARYTASTSLKCKSEAGPVGMGHGNGTGPDRGVEVQCLGLTAMNGHAASKSSAG